MTRLGQKFMPMLPITGDVVLKGGSYRDVASSALCSARTWGIRHDGYETVGFRTALGGDDTIFQELGASAAKKKPREAIDLRVLRQQLSAYFNLSELKTLSFVMGIDYEIFTGESKSEFVLSMVTLIVHRDRLPELVDLIRREQPFLISVQEEMLGKLPDDMGQERLIQLNNLMQNAFSLSELHELSFFLHVDLVATFFHSYSLIGWWDILSLSSANTACRSFLTSSYSGLSI